MSKTDRLADLKKEYTSCALCKELVNNRTNIVFGVGDPEKCKLVIIGEAPGYYEDVKNEPFVGKSGQELNKLLASIGLSRDEVYITNTILCRPPENRNPKAEELKNCRARLDKQIEILNPRLVITLGNFATQYMLDTKQGITKLRGKVVEKNGIQIMPMFHPATILYNGGKNLHIFEEDFNNVAEILKLPPQKREQQRTLL